MGAIPYESMGYYGTRMTCMQVQHSHSRSNCLAFELRFRSHDHDLLMEFLKEVNKMHINR